jgi:hypothetical protein
MKIECVLKRIGGTITDIGGVQYHFEPLADGAHVSEVEIDSHVDRFLSIAEGYKLYRGTESPKGKPTQISKLIAMPVAVEEKKHGGGLKGSDMHSSQYEIGGQIYSLGDVVRKAFVASGLSEDDWNELDEDDRAARIDITLDDIADAAESAPTANDADEAVANDNKAQIDEDGREALADAYLAKFGKRPHGKWTADKIKSELEA